MIYISKNNGVSKDKLKKIISTEFGDESKKYIWFKKMV